MTVHEGEADPRRPGRQHASESARFDIPVSAAEAGKKTISAEARFVICQEQACKPVKETLALAIDVSAAPVVAAAQAEGKPGAKTRSHREALSGSGERAGLTAEVADDLLHPPRELRRSARPTDGHRQALGRGSPGAPPADVLGASRASNGARALLLRARRA